MAYTYNLSATVRGGKRSIWDSVWDGSSAEDERRAGLTGTSTYHQCSMIFNTSSLAGKTITGINLTFTVVSGTIPGNGTNNFPICYKADSSTTSWKRSSTSAVGYIKNQTSGGGSYGASNTQMTVNMGTTLPSYGYVAGSIQSPSGSYKSVILGSTATLAVTTNETYREYTLAYNANGGSGAPGSTSAGNIQVNPSCTFTVSSTVPTRTGYDFLGWSTSSTATSASYVGGNSITVTTAGTTTLYAVWKLKTYTVAYNKGSYGTGTNTTATKTYNVALTLKGATFTRTGYTQTSWYSTSPAPQQFALGGSYTANADITLYPTWTPNTYTVSYNANGGTAASVPAAQTKTYGATLTLSSTKPTRANEAAGSCTVSYDGNGGSTPTASAANRTTSYAFKNWNTAVNGSGAAYESGGSYTANAAATLYAQWTPTTTTASVTLPTPTRTGYRFDGWFTAKTDGTQVTSPYTPGGNVTNVTLYAHWTATSATLSSVSPTTVLCGNTLTGSWTSTGSYYYRLKVTCGNGEEKWSSITAVGASSATVTIPTTWYSMSNGPMKNSETASATCTLYTYSNSAGTTQVGTATSLPFTAKVPDNVAPTLSSLTYKASSDNPVVSGWGDNVFVQGYSKVTLTLSVSSYNGSALKSVSFSGEGWTSSGTSLTSPASTVVNRSDQVKFTAYCTDTRNHQSQISVNVPFEAYSPPTVSTIVVGRSDKNGNDNNSSGAWIKFTPKFSYSSCGGHNQLSTHTAQYTLHGSSAVLGSLTCTSDITYAPINAEATPPTGTIWPVSATSAYDVSVILVDSIQANAGTNTTLTTTLPSVQGIWFGKGNDRLGLGGVPSGPGLHVDWNAEFNGTLDVTPRRCEATLPTSGNGVGWYRAIVYNAYDTSSAQGTSGEIVTIKIVYTSAVSVQHEISLFMTKGKVAFLNEISHGTTNLVDQIRYNYNGSTGYIDIHWTTTTACYVNVSFDVASRNYAQGGWVAGALTSVAESPANETELTRYTFAENTEYTRYIWTPTFSGTANPSVSNALCFYSVKNNVLYAGGRFNLASFTSGSTTVSFTLPVSLGSADRSAETIGTMFTTTKTLQLRWTGATVYITDAGGNFSGGLLNTGYWSFQIVAPIYNQRR